MMRRLPIPISIVCLAVLASPAAASAAKPPIKPAKDHGPLGNETLSNETTITRWGHTNLLGAVRKEPTTSSKAIDKLHWNTEDGVPEVYIALESRLADNGEVWLKIRIPGRPNGRTGWVREEQISNLKVVRTHLTIDRGALKATLKNKGKTVWTSRVGVGKASTPTPKGKFWIRERLSNLGGSPVYGPWAFGTSAYSDKLTDWPGGGVVGIHGTNQPYLIPGRPSHGCVRVPNGNIRKLKRLMPVGTPLTIV